MLVQTIIVSLRPKSNMLYLIKFEESWEVILNATVRSKGRKAAGN